MNSEILNISFDQLNFERITGKLLEQRATMILQLIAQLEQAQSENMKLKAQIEAISQN